MSIVYKLKTYMTSKRNGKCMHRLKEVFVEKKTEGKSQKEAAEYLGIDHRSVSRHMNQDNIGIDVLNKYAEYLNVDVSKFLMKPIDRQINCYVDSQGAVHFYGETEQRPSIKVATASWWWSATNNIIAIDQSFKQGYSYGFVSVYEKFKNFEFIKGGEEAGLVKFKDGTTKACIVSRIENKFSAYNWYVPRDPMQSLEGARFARFMATYDSQFLFSDY